MTARGETGLAPPVRATLWGLTILVAILGFLSDFMVPPNHDVAWFLTVAEKWLQGDVLYRDVLDVNPPLIVWLSSVPVLVSRVLPLSGEVVYRILLAVVIVSSIASTSWLAAKVWRRREALLAATAVLVAALVLFPSHSFGQREHLAFSLFLPYLGLAYARDSGYRPPVGVALAVGACASLGIAIKPFFVFPLVLCEGWVRFTDGQPERLRRTEAWTATALLAGYGIAVVTLHPQYVDQMLRVGPAYRAWSSHPVSTILVQPQLLLLAVVSGAVALDPRSLRQGEVGIPLLCAYGFLAAVLVQKKGFAYHYYPVMASSLLVVPGVLRRSGRASNAVRAVARTAVAFVLVLFLFGAVYARAGSLADSVSGTETPLDEEVRTVRNYVEPGDGLAVLSIDLRPAFPLVNLTGTEWSLGVPSVWFLHVGYRPCEGGEKVCERAISGDQRSGVGWLSRRASEDLRRSRPRVILAQRGIDADRFVFDSLDVLAAFKRAAPEAVEWSRYTARDTVHGLEVLVRGSH